MAQRSGDQPQKQDTIKRLYDPAVKQLQQVLQKAIDTKADPEVIEGLKTALRYGDLRDEFTTACTSQESDPCRKISEATVAQPWTKLKEEGKTIWNLTPRMLSGSLEGQFLKSLIGAQRARRVLDVGMYTGYSALSMAEALPAGGEVVTLDIDPFLKQYNQPYFDASPHGSKITVRIGSALQTMQDLVKEGQQFDFIFLDADKSEYIDCLKLAIDKGLLAENGTIAMDNAFCGGLSYLPSERLPDARVFADHVMNDKRLHKVLVPIRDGVLLIRRLAEVERDSSD